MKKFLSLLSLAAAIAILFFGYLFGKRGAVLDSTNESGLSQVAAMKGGRLMPLSSAAADTLRYINGKSSVEINGKNASASEWLAYINTFPLEAAKLPFLKTDNRELQNLLGIKGRYYSYLDIEKKYDDIAKSAIAQDNSVFTKACRDALQRLATYEVASSALAFYFQGATPRDTFDSWRKMGEDAAKEIKQARDDGREPDASKLAETYRYLKYFKDAKEREDAVKDSNIRLISDGENWLTPLDVLLDPRPAAKKGELLALYGDTVAAISKSDQAGAAKKIEEINRKNVNSFRLKFENFFNRLDIFYRGAILYIVAFVSLVLGSAYKKHSTAFYTIGAIFLIVGFFAQTFGVFARMFIQMRPPVTNLYSSIIFAGWAAVGFGLFLLIKRRNILYAFAAVPIGFLSILVALNLPYSGDTMGMMRAVLNSNFWLSTHIIPMMLGYCGVFLAGFTASLKLISNAISLGKYSAESVFETSKSVYIMLCFGMVFSFAGTMLGGVWADVSWGRFWGWDPKENGALMVVLWCAFAVHCKVLGQCKARAILALACIGNVIAAWAWFGVNMLGVGLHSYGFMDSGWMWLVLFAVIQTAIAFLALIPPSKIETPKESIKS